MRRAINKVDSEEDQKCAPLGLILTFFFFFNFLIFILLSVHLSLIYPYFRNIGRDDINLPRTVPVAAIVGKLFENCQISSTRSPGGVTVTDAF